MDATSTEYKRAFDTYFRKGIPMSVSLKQTGLGLSYAPHLDANTDIYSVKTRETLSHVLQGLSSRGRRWQDRDFVGHFYTGNGGTVTLSQIGHLREIAEHWAYGLGRLDRWNRQIIRKARNVGNGSVHHNFGPTSYNFGAVEFSHGGATVTGGFVGSVQTREDFLIISGRTAYIFSDRFTDPGNARELIAWLRERPNRAKRVLQTFGNFTGIRQKPISPRTDIKPDDFNQAFIILTDLGGMAYDISGSWTSTMQAVIFQDTSQSRY